MVEVAAAMVAGSVLLAADSIHLGVDLAAFGIAWGAAKLTTQPGSSTFERAAAVVNAAVLALAAWHVAGEAFESIAGHGHLELDTGIALAAAMLRLAASHRAMRIMQEGDLGNPNERAIEQHCRMETYASAGMVATLLFAAATGAEFADPLVALVIAAMMLRAAYGILRITLASGR